MIWNLVGHVYLHLATVGVCDATVQKTGITMVLGDIYWRIWIDIWGTLCDSIFIYRWMAWSTRLVGGRNSL